MVPLYFLAHESAHGNVTDGTPSRDLLRRHGLLELLGDVKRHEWAAMELSGRGPEGLPGLIVAAQSVAGQVPRSLGYFPNQQTWIQCGEKTYLGYDPQDLPTPGEVRRHEQIDGHRVKLGDDQEWLVPIVRDWRGSTRLPQAFGVDASGQFTMKRLAKWDALWQAAEPVAAAFYSPASAVECALYGPALDDLGNRNWQRDEAFRLCVRFLAANYRIDPHLATVLGLIRSDNWQEVLSAVVDVPTVSQLLAAEKKTAADVGASGLGSGG